MNELAFLVTPIGVAFMVFILATLSVHLVTTMRALKDQRRVQATLLRAAKLKARRSFTVLIHLSRRADSIWPLLDHLAHHNYRKLQVIVVVRQTAGSKAAATLRAYRRTMPALSLSIVTYRKGLLDADVIRRYGTGDYIMTMMPAMRLSPQFFTYLSYALVERPAAMLVRYYRRPDRTLLSAFASLDALWRAIGYRMAHRTHSIDALEPSIVMAKRALLAGQPVEAKSVLFEDYGIDLTYAPVMPFISSRSSAVAATIIVAFGIVAAWLIIASTPVTVVPFVIALMACLYLFSSIIIMTSMKGYSTIQFLLLSSVVPFYPSYLILRTLIEGARLLVRS